MKHAVAFMVCGFVITGILRGNDAAGKIPPEVYHRTVFLGDSITDGDTYPQLVRDALDHGDLLLSMVSINAGIGGDTAHGMLARLERDVLAFHPTLVTLSAGANDAGKVPPAEYERHVRAIADRLTHEHISMILLTPNMVGPRLANKQKDLDAYEAILRRIAREHGFRVAEVNQRQREAAAAGVAQMTPDDIHPNWEGQRSIARAVLDAMGYGELKVPDEIAAHRLPGLITPWWVRKIEAKAPALTAASVGSIKPDATWIVLTPPETEPTHGLDSSNDRWLLGYRARGACVSLRHMGPAKYVGLATLSSDVVKSMQFHTGADLEQVWLNGKLIYQAGPVFRGYHIGRESVSGELQVGENKIVIRTGPVFFLSATETGMWEEKK